MRLSVRFGEYLWLVLAVAGLPKAALAATDDAAHVAARYHCAGGAQLAGQTNLPALQKAFALPSKVPAQKLALANLSRLLANSFPFGTNASAAALLEPLLSDVLETESMGSFGGSGDRSPGFVLALRLDAKRTQLWRNNLARVFSGPGTEFTAEDFKGWRWKAGATDSFWIMPAGGWLLVGRGDDLLPVQAEYLRQVSRQGRPGPVLTEKWLEADLDGSRLAAWLPDGSRLFKAARIKISIAAETNNVHTTARLIYPQAIPWHAGPWHIPVELVLGPVISFTAGQNLAAFLNLDPVFSRLADSPLTNQFYIWALKGVPFLSYMAWPAANAAASLERLSTNAPAALNPGLKRLNGAELVWRADRRKLVLSNLPAMTPALEAVPETAGQFLLAGLFPPVSLHKTVPDDLWKQIRGRTNLVYYDWESTGPRLQEWRLLGRMLLRWPRGQTDDTADAMQIEEKWLGQLAPLAGNTVTEVTWAAPNELSVVRNSPVGFTGFEMFLLAGWLSAAGSPPNHSPPRAP